MVPLTPYACVQRANASKPIILGRKIEELPEKRLDCMICKREAKLVFEHVAFTHLLVHSVIKKADSGFSCCLRPIERNVSAAQRFIGRGTTKKQEGHSQTGTDAVLEMTIAAIDRLVHQLSDNPFN